MNFAETFIKRPVATTLLVLTILIFGVMGYMRLPVADLPTVDYPVIQVNANLPGANPDTMASSVATPLEKQFSTISGITSISSRSSQGSTNISVTFDLDRDIDSAAQDIQTAIARSSRSLPPGMPSPPSYNKSNPADTPVLFLTLTSDTLPLSQVDRYAENVIAQRLSMVTGVAQVNVFGAQKYAVRVDIDPTQLDWTNPPDVVMVASDPAGVVLDPPGSASHSGSYPPRCAVATWVNSCENTISSALLNSAGLSTT